MCKRHQESLYRQVLSTCFDAFFWVLKIEVVYPKCMCSLFSCSEETKSNLEMSSLYLYPSHIRIHIPSPWSFLFFLCMVSMIHALCWDAVSICQSKRRQVVSKGHCYVYLSLWFSQIARQLDVILFNEHYHYSLIHIFFYHCLSFCGYGQQEKIMNTIFLSPQSCVVLPFMMYGFKFICKFGVPTVSNNLTEEKSQYHVVPMTLWRHNNVLLILHDDTAIRSLFSRQIEI